MQGELALVSIQFPDPHFKKRHHKRRIVQPELVEAICRRLRPGGRVFMQSDVEEVRWCRCPPWTAPGMPC